MAGSKDLLLFTREDGRTSIQFDDDDDDIFQKGLKPAPNLEIESISQMKGHPNSSMSLLKWTHVWGIFSGISFDFFVTDHVELETNIKERPDCCIPKDEEGRWKWMKMRPWKRRLFDWDDHFCLN